MGIGTGKFGRGLAAGALLAAAAAAGAAFAAAVPAPGETSRIALVIGESNYRTGPLPTAANDAGLIADTLQRAGFDVTGAADLDRDGLRKTLGEFVQKAAAAGPGAIAFVYISGRGVQYSGDNYIAPIDARIARAEDVPLEAVRLGDYLQPLARMPMRAKVVALDAERTNSFAQTGDPLAGGLALVDAAPGELIAFNAAPGAVAPDGPGPYGDYAQALAEALREPGLPIDQAFSRTRMRVAQQTQGAAIPWDDSKLTAPPALFARPRDARRVAVDSVTWLRARPIRDYTMADAFNAALDRDTFQAYRDFLAVFPDSPYAPRVRAVLAARREATMWRRAHSLATPEAYWTYLRFYPRGPHAYDARRGLADLGASREAPAQFHMVDLGAPPPPPSDHAVLDRRFVVFDDPGGAPPPPPPAGFLPPPAVIVSEAPPPPPHAGLLPLPAAVAPLAGAAVATQIGAIHAPAVVKAQAPDAQSYYNRLNGRAAPQGGAQDCGKPDRSPCR